MGEALKPEPSRSMVRIWTLSGEELVPRCTDGHLGTVKSLKQHLHQQHGYPPRFRQALIHDGSPLNDQDSLEPHLDLQLLLLPFQSPCRARADDLVAAAGTGSLARVEGMLISPQDPNLTLRDSWESFLLFGYYNS